MKLQKHFAKKIGKKKYYKYVVVLPEKLVKKAGFKVKQELEGEAKKGEVKLRKR
jgi:hypothetical protein